MLQPDFDGGSILNLVASIEKALDGTPKYKELTLLPANEISGFSNVVLMVIDGLGFEFLQKNGKGTVFAQHLKGKMTSVFPSTTSAAIPAFMTGLSPQEHGMLGWYVFLQEFGSVVIPLPFVARLDKEVSLQHKIPIEDVFRLDPLADRIKAEPFLVKHKDYCHSAFSVASAGKSKRFDFDSRTGFFEQVQKIVSASSKEKKFVFAYYDVHDSLCHEFGVDSKEVLRHFRELETDFRSFLSSIEGTNTLLIVTADHGLIDIPKEKTISLNAHPELLACLSVPPTGEHRFVYCSVKPEKEKAFVQYVQQNFGSACELFRSSVFARQGFFGRFKEHPQFFQRIGDYVLIAKENWGFDYRPAFSKPHPHVGHHGGLSKEELFVPLIVVKK